MTGGATAYGGLIMGATMQRSSHLPTFHISFIQRAGANLYTTANRVSRRFRQEPLRLFSGSCLPPGTHEPRRSAMMLAESWPDRRRVSYSGHSTVLLESFRIIPSGFSARNSRHSNYRPACPHSPSRNRQAPAAPIAAPPPPVSTYVLRTVSVLS